MTRAHRDDEGQALIAVALAMVVLLGALGLGLDWGLALTQRRIAQNAADAAVMGASRWLATSTVLSGGAIVFGIDQEQVYCYAKAYADADRKVFAPPSGQTTTFTIQYGDAATPTNWTTSRTSSSCPPTAAGTPVPPGTVYVRATSGATYRSTIAAVFGMPQITAEASAKARMTGTVVAGGLKSWPMVRHYNAADFDLGTCRRAPCDLPPLEFWSSSGSLSDMVYGNFKGLMDFSIWSTRFPVSSQVPQLLEDWDRTGSVMAGTSPKNDMSGNCGGPWDTHGDSDPANNNKQCSVTNWFYYPFGGRLSVSLDHVSSVPAGQETPSDIGPRSAGVCASPPPGLLAPSCTAGSYGAGDWVETAFGNLGSNVSDLLKQFIQENGGPGARTNDFIPGSSTTKYGKALVMYVYLWDCAETFNSSAPAGDQWSLVLPRTGDCSQISNGAGIPTIDRVHLFTVAPFTFYEGLITTTKIEGFWGGAFGDPAACQTDTSRCRPLDLFMNTAFPVGDD